MGDVDSSLIALYSSKAKKEKWEYYTAGFDDGSIDESRQAKELIDMLNIKSWNVLFPNSYGFMKDIEDMSYTIELPTFSAGTYLQYYLMQNIAKDGIKEVLDGTGGRCSFCWTPLPLLFFLE